MHFWYVLLALTNQQKAWEGDWFLDALFGAVVGDLACNTVRPSRGRFGVGSGRYESIGDR